MKALKRCQTSPSSSNSSSPSSSSSSSSWIHLRSLLLIVASSPASCASSDRAHTKSPWSHRERKHILSPQWWNSLFTHDGKFRDGGVKFLKKVRGGGVDPVIRAEAWPFLLGVYDLCSSKEERNLLRTQNRKEYERLRKRCQRLLKHNADSIKLKEIDQISANVNGGCLIKLTDSPESEDVVSVRESSERSTYVEYLNHHSGTLMEGDTSSRRVTNPFAFETDSSESDSSADPEICQTFPSTVFREENDTEIPEDGSYLKTEEQTKFCSVKDFTSWQRIIRLDAVRTNEECIAYSATQATVSEGWARRSAEAIGLKDYDHLEPCRIFHATRLVAILEAYALYDPEIGYCQGMSDLLSPIIAVITEDHEAFWCFVGFMQKARHNFRLDEVGIIRQLNMVSKIIKCKDSHLYRHLENLQAEDCFFVYRMVIVLFRRELTFEQTICLWEVMWADQAAIRSGFRKSGWSRIRQRAPPTDDLLLYAIAASVLQRRKQIIEKYSSVDEIVKECNNMAGHLDVWKLLDDAHNLVVTLHDKIETPF